MTRRAALRIAPFEIDITPPVGEAIAYGINRRVDAPIFVRGVLLDDGRTRALLGAADIIGLYGAVYPEWRLCMAQAARVPVRNVLIHCVHQHDSLRPFPPELRALLRGFHDPRIPSERFHRDLLRRLDVGLRRANKPGNWQRVEALATAERRLSGLASNRRLLGPDGKVFAMRWSMTSDPKLQRHPVGRIDPLLRSIGFLGSRGRLLASLHFYATHPMGAYGREMVSADIPGVALEYLGRAVKAEGAHVYFTGCAGDITFGKYTFKSKEQNLAVLGRRLGEGLAANVSALQERPLGPLRLRFEMLQVRFDARRMNPAKLLAKLRLATTYQEAALLAWHVEIARGWRRYGKPVLARLDLGPETHVLSLPAETAVAYQLFAQALVPERFVAVAAYGDGSLSYIPTAEMFREGGYEPKFGYCTPQIEARYRRALERLLADLR